MKKIIFIIGLTGAALLLNSCFAGYVASEPTYVEYSRPERPGDQYVWIDGDWGYNNHNHNYVQRPGYWEKTRPNQNFIPGHWQSTPKGKSWSKGHWNKHGRR